MNRIKHYCSALLLLVMAAGCSEKDGIEDDLSFLNSAAASKVDKIFDISNDNSGNVKITPLGEGVSSYTVNFGHGTGAAASAVVMPGNSVTHAYPEGSYTVNIVAKDIAGKETTTTYPLKVTYRAPEKVDVKIDADMRVSATADYAKSFMVYYGDVANETGTPLALGQTLPAHIYPAGTATPYTLRVVALSGGAATTAVTKALFGFPIDFETAAVDYFFGTFGNVNFSRVANPAPGGINTSAMVGKYEKPSNAETLSGTYSPLNIPMNMAYGKKVKVLVYNPSAANIGKMLNVELEAAVAGTGATANGVAVLKAPITKSGEWEELVFDFGTIAAIPNTARFNQLVLRFNDVARGAGEVIYLDNFRLTN